MTGSYSGFKLTEYNFNSHAHVERDAMLPLKGGKEMNFNSHAHVERDIKIGVYSNGVVNFNSHAHVERDSRFVNTTEVYLQFQLTRSRGA